MVDVDRYESRYSPQNVDGEIYKTGRGGNMNGGIPENFLPEIAGLANRAAQAEALQLQPIEVIEEERRKVYVLPGGKTLEVDLTEDSPYAPPSCYGSIDAVAQVCTRYFTPEKTIARVTTSGIFVSYDRTGLQRNAETIQAGFYTGDLPRGSLSYEELLTFLDKNTGEVTGLCISDGQEIVLTEDEVRESLKTLTFANAEKVTVTDNGPVIAVEVVKREGLEPVKTKLPKILEVKLRFGLREYLIPCRFRLKIGADMQYGLEQIPKDGALDEYLEKATTDLRDALGDGWLVVQGD